MAAQSLGSISRPEGYRPKRVAVATPHRLATAAGTRAIEAGGNALDAALAAAAALVVVYPHACSLGGDLIALVRDPSGGITVVNSTGASSASSRSEEVAGLSSMPERGPLSITVPGIAAGWEAIGQLGCGLSLPQRLEDAISLAIDGCPVSRSVDRAVRENTEVILGDRGLTGILVHEGKPVDRSDVLIQTSLGRTLEHIADTGLMDFYEGPLADRVAAGLQAAGSSITTEDLAAHQVERTEPLSVHFYDWSVFAPPPNSQGFALLAMLLAVENLKPDLLGKSAASLAQMFRIISHERDSRLADPRVVGVEIEDLLKPSTIRRLCRVAPDHLSSATSLRGDRKGDTVAVVAADDEGWVVSLIQSVFSSFGSGILDPSTGILFHNRGYGFSLDHRSPNRWQPGKRPAHTLTPAIASSRHGSFLSLGTMGGLAQPQILTQVLTRIARGESLGKAVDAPRWIVGGMQSAAYDEVHAERRVPRAAIDAFTESGLFHVPLGDRDERVGQSNALLLEHGRLLAIADPRSDSRR
jgi:gamma-glutamyltranspeptidase